MTQAQISTQTQPSHYLRLDRDTYYYLFDRTTRLKREFKAYIPCSSLADRTLAMIFEKSSTRTRLSFEAGIQQMGGYAVFLSTRDSQLGRGEPIEDAAQVISRMVDLIMIRTFGQDVIERFAAYSRVPVINGLTNEFHPCQVLADIFTFVEHRGNRVDAMTGKTVAWIGDANNMCYTWIQAAKVLGFHVNVSTPKQYPLDLGLIAGCEASMTVFADPFDACRDADIVTTDVWTSMGFEAEQKQRFETFQSWEVTPEMMARAKPDALFMHCLPAHRGEEVSAAVIDGPQSVVWDEAENRMHTQKALMEYLVRGKV
jgi:ornithine carbamoyltransferase